MKNWLLAAKFIYLQAFEKSFTSSASRTDVVIVLLEIELKSFLGRLYSSKIRQTKKKYLQLGSGNLDQNSKIENLDFYNINKKNLFGLKNFF